MNDFQVAMMRILYKRKEKLEAWSNRVARHPVLSHSFVFRYFLMCSEEQVGCPSVSLSA